MRTKRFLCYAACLVLPFLAARVEAQTTAFTYQGRLTDAGNPANGNYDMQFKLFDTPTVGTGTPQGSTVTNPTVQVAAGGFTVQLDFGATVFNGAARYLEIGVRPSGSPNPYTVLNPRTQITSSPYAIQTINAQQLGGIPANQFVQTNDARLSDSRNPLPNSPNYIQNTTSPQAASNFNVAGSGTVGTLNANGAFTIGGVTAPAVAPAGQGRLYFDSGTNKFRVSQSGGAFIDLIDSGAVNGTGTANTIPVWSAATTIGNSALTQFGTNIGIGSASPNGRLGIANSPPWTLHFWGGAVEMENASAVGWRGNSSGYRFGLGRTTDGFVMFRTAVDIGNTSGSPPLYDFKIDNQGNVGIGNTTLNMALDAKLTLVTAGGFGLENTNGVTTLSTYVGQSIPTNTPAGGWLGTRTNHPLYFFTNGSSPKATLSPSGNFGIGIINPFARLEVASPGNSAADYTARFQSSSSVAGAGGIVFDQNSTFGWKIHTENTASSNGRLHFGYIDVTTGAPQPSTLVLTGFGNVGIGTTTPNAKLSVAGDVTQPSSFGGLAKAMIYVNGINDLIVRCFNGTTDDSVGNCGFSVSRVPGTFSGRYVINFGFPVNNRFVIVTGNGLLAMVFNTGNSDEQEVQTFDLSGQFGDSNFTIVVF